MNRFLRELWLLPVALAFGPTFLHLWDRWTEAESYYVHGPWTLFFALVTLGVLGSRRSGTSTTEIRTGQRLIIASMMLQGLGVWLAINVVQYVALSGVLLGVAIQWRGRWLVRAHPWIWGLVLLSFPLPSFFVVEIAYRLRVASSEATVWLIRLWGQAELVGNELTFRLSGARDLNVTVGEACSGLKTWLAMLVMACALAAWERGLKRQLWLVLAALPAALIGNTLRITAICVLMNFGYGEWALGSGHATLGVVTFLVALGLLGFSARFWPESAPANIPASSPRASSSKKFCLGISILSFSLIALPPALKTRTQISDTSFAPREVTSIPRGWTTTESPLDETTFKILGTREARMIQLKESALSIPIYVLVVQARSESTAAHPPEICLEADGWEVQTSRVIARASGSEMVESTYVRRGSQNKLLVIHWYEMDGQRTAHFMTYQMWHWRALLVPSHPPGRLVRISVPIEPGTKSEDAKAAAERYLALMSV